MVLIDSSVWIEVLRSKADSSLSQDVENLLSAGLASLTEPVWLELYRGLKGKREEARLNELRELCHWLEFDRVCWSRAAEIARGCQRKGVIVPTGDLLVFSCARRHRVALLHRDRHFDLLARHHPE